MSKNSGLRPVLALVLVAAVIVGLVTLYVMPSDRTLPPNSARPEDMEWTEPAAPTVPPVADLRPAEAPGVAPAPAAPTQPPVAPVQRAPQAAPSEQPTPPAIDRSAPLAPEERDHAQQMLTLTINVAAEEHDLERLQVAQKVVLVDSADEELLPPEDLEALDLMIACLEHGSEGTDRVRDFLNSDSNSQFVEAVEKACE